jgi:polysaccharide export outer membrane protein
MRSRSSPAAAVAALALATAAGGLPAFATAQSPAPAGSASADAAQAYRVQPGDLLTISVWKEHDLQSDVLVLPDGGLSFPLAGEIDAKGLTVSELQAAVVDRLKRYIPDPVVTIQVKAIGGNRIYVIGKVGRPGEITFSKPLDVMQALSVAGGATPFASLNDIVILRRDNGIERVLPFRYGDVERGRGLRQNVLLESGDTVVVP